MNCPNCEGKLESKTFKKVRIEECDKCQGLWFDRDELRRAKDSTDEDLNWLDFDVFEDKDGKFEKTPSDKNCPIDSASLERLTYSHSKIYIDSCPKCEGVWLDHGEFNRVIDYLEKTILTTTANEYAKESVEEFVEIFNGPEHKKSEIKDFYTVLKLGETRLGVEHEKITAFLTFFPIR